jgi:hypothetical protein
MVTRQLLSAGVLLLGLGLSQAHADPYRWCAMYTGDAGGASNCGFVTLAQCQATVSGIGGSCEPNQFYTGSEAPRSTPLRKDHRK